ncbi:conserved hypothetical protein [Burkholderiales bacterium 8X]|nr:conserved hypothetical protein [Burkholderiales bacterium 8X]
MAEQRKLIRVVVDGHLCVGAGMCVASHPEFFAMQPDGHAAYVAGTLNEAAALEAEELCPVSAIQLIYQD